MTDGASIRAGSWMPTMSYDDQRPTDPRDRGAYTPPTDDDLPFHRGGFDARRAPPAKAPPVTLIISALVLLALIVAVVVFYRAGVRSPNDAPPAVGTPVGSLRVEAPIDAQPIDAEAGVGVYRDEAEPAGATPTFTPPPEAVMPRPAPRPLVPEAVAPTPAPTAAAPTPAAPVARPVPAAPAPTPPAAAAGGTSAVQIGAFSSTAIADREFAAVAARFPAFARGAQKRVQEVTASNGSTVYRTTFTGLSRDQAQAFCAAIKAAGDDCLVR